MNAVRRKKLKKLHATISEVYEALEELRDEEECNMSNMPENLHTSERYNRAEAAVCAIESAISSLAYALDFIEEAKE